MHVDSTTVAPGDRVAITFASKPIGRWRRSSLIPFMIRRRLATADLRGVAYSLSVRDGSDWRVAYWLTSDRNGGEPSWWAAADSEGHGWHDVGVSGPGPDYVVIPTTAVDGDYLLRSADASPSTGRSDSLSDCVSTETAIGAGVHLQIRA